MRACASTSRHHTWQLGRCARHCVVLLPVLVLSGRQRPRSGASPIYSFPMRRLPCRVWRAAHSVSHGSAPPVHSHACIHTRAFHAQLEFCEATLSPAHPLAAKMLAVMARLRNRQGDEVECERLVTQVLAMRRAALGLHHEDTHRSAMDVYSRRRSHVLREAHDAQGYVEMAAAMDVCFEMLQHAAVEKGGAHGFALSKSLQGMGELLFQVRCAPCHAPVRRPMRSVPRAV